MLIFLCVKYYQNLNIFYKGYLRSNIFLIPNKYIKINIKDIFFINYDFQQIAER